MNNKHKKQLHARNALATAISCVTMGVALVPAYASDTEIYTQTVTSAESAPTVMMVLDTSGSMEYCMNSTASSTCSVSSNRRINVLRSALNTVLLGKVGATPETTIAAAPGFVKMGYARFNPDANKGGWVRYPARPLDAFVNISPNGTVTPYGLDGKSDTVQTTTTPNGNTLSTLTVGPASDVGLSFSNVMVPKGAVVTEAYIELTASANNSSSGEMLVKIEDSVTPVDYTSSTVNSRTYATTESPFVPDAWVKESTYKIPVNGLVDYMVNKSSWCGGNNINFKLSNKDAVSLVQRQAYAFEAGATLKPKLFVRYTIDPNKTDSCIKTSLSSTFTPKVSSDDAYYYDSDSSLSTTDTSLYVNYVSSGKVLRNIVRFPDVIIPQGATITSATLTGLSNNTRAVTAVKPINVEAYAADNVTPLCTSTCPKPTYGLTSSVLWSVSGGSIPKASTGTRVAVDVTSLVQTVVNRAGWLGKNALALRLSNSTTTTNDNAILSTVDKSLSSAMNLSVSWTKEVRNLKELRTVREDILADLDFLQVSGGTPLGAAYAEASRYMLGMEPDVKGGSADFGDGTSYPVHDPRVLNSAQTRFVSPVETGGCSGNYLFMMSDGEPNNLANVLVNSKGITGTTCGGDGADVSGSGKSLNWKCMFDVAAWNLRSNNQIKVPIRTTTVYFGPTSSTIVSDHATILENLANMKTVATKGDGDAFQATDEAKLVEALTKTIKKAVDAGGTIAAPGVAVNQLNRLNHLDQLYYAVFDPKPNAYSWEGNLKRYRLAADGSSIVDASTPPALAVDPSTGFFKETSKSFWSDTTDGNKTVEGGAASMLPKPNPSSSTDQDYRRMFTFMGTLTTTNVPLTAIKLGDAAFDTAAKTAMGITNTTIYTNLMNWYKGYVIPKLDDSVVSTTGAAERNRLGGALHSQPVVVNYGYTGLLADAGKAENQINVIFISTLEGTLHGIDAKTGVEKFSFIPGEKLATLKSRYDNPTSTNPEFGMDLTWTFLRQDTDKNGQISTGDKLYLYGGMRMGGDNYYALDVTNLDSPKLLFAIDGGATGSYANMGQTWSQPVVANIKIAGVIKPVLVFGGGYDMAHEVNTLHDGVTNNKGNQLYIVDALTGQLVWYASGNSSDTGATMVSDMKFSVPTAPNVVDIDLDGVADAIYFGDLGGQVFRADVNPQALVNTGVIKRVKLLAKLGETTTSTSSNQRRFYEPPSVALFKDANNVSFAAVAQGSGYRSRPLNTQIDEHFYVFFDYDLPRYDLATVADTGLQSVISNTDLVKLDLASTTVQTNGVDVTGKRGWYVDFPESGEKALAPALIFKNKLLFSTYTPLVSGGKCSPVIGKTKLYTFCMPYGKLCSATTSYIKDNVMVGLGGEPQLMIIKDPDPLKPDGYKVVLITGTAVDDQIFSDVDVSLKIQPLQKWREKAKK